MQLRPWCIFLFVALEWAIQVHTKGYKVVFRQTLPYLYKRNEWRKNPTDPSNDNYSILDELEQFRNDDGRFYFRMVWPGDATVYEWSQTSNPVSETLAGYQAISVPYTGLKWGGLEPSKYALMDGSINTDMWFYAIGAYQRWSNGIPSYAKTDNDAGYPKQAVELYVRTEPVYKHVHETMQFCKPVTSQGDWSTEDLKSIRNDLNWGLHTHGNAVCNIGNTGGINKCAKICESVEGCRYFSVSETSYCYACFIYKTCDDPVIDPHQRNYSIFEIQEVQFGFGIQGSGICSKGETIKDKTLCKDACRELDLPQKQILGDFECYKSKTGDCYQNGQNRAGASMICKISKNGADAMRKQEYPGGCYKISTPENCCKYVDGRENTPYHKQTCVAVTNVTQPVHDTNYPCQPLCFAMNECGNNFKGNISNFCEKKDLTPTTSSTLISTAPTTTTSTMMTPTPTTTLPMTSTVPQPNLFILGSSGEDACPTRYKAIYDEDLCKKASNDLNLVYSDADNDGKSGSVCNWCGGCYPKTVRLDYVHGELAKWICQAISAPTTQSTTKSSSIKQMSSISLIDSSSALITDSSIRTTIVPEEFNYTVVLNKTCQGERPAANLEDAFKLCDFTSCEGIHDKDCNGKNIVLCDKVLDFAGNDGSKSNECIYVKKEPATKTFTTEKPPSTVCKTTNQKTIKIDGAKDLHVPDQNKECVFPFKGAILGKMHYECTPLDGVCSDCFVCGTRNVTDVNAGWGLCNDECPRENKVWILVLIVLSILAAVAIFTATVIVICRCLKKRKTQFEGHNSKRKPIDD